eukprot:642274-Pleurochrysis_carterae.AAC.2
MLQLQIEVLEHSSGILCYNRSARQLRPGSSPRTVRTSKISRRANTAVLPFKKRRHAPSAGLHRLERRYLEWKTRAECQRLRNAD